MCLYIGLSILPLSTIFLLEFGTAPTMLYVVCFGILFVCLSSYYGFDIFNLLNENVCYLNHYLNAMYLILLQYE